jgi:multiple antibiotic resistance protein
MHPLLTSFIKLFVTIDPLGTLPVFLALTTGMGADRRRQVTYEAVIFALLIAVCFMFLGNAIFHFIGITETDFLIAGGFILFLLAMIDLLIPGKPAVVEQATVGLFPLAMPLIAGPATITSTLVLAKSKDYGYGYTAASLILNFSLLLIVLLSANTWIRLLGLPALRGISKLVMVLLAALAINMIRTGIGQAFMEMHQH